VLQIILASWKKKLPDKLGNKMPVLFHQCISRRLKTGSQMTIKIRSVLSLVLAFFFHDVHAELAYKNNPACAAVMAKVSNLVISEKYREALTIVLQEQSRYPLKKDTDTSAVNLCLEIQTANFYRKLGDTSKAAESLKTALENIKDELGDGSAVRVYAQVSLAAVYISTSHFNDAVWLLEDAKNTVLHAQSHYSLELIYANLAEVYANLGDNKKALEYDLAAYAAFKFNPDIGNNKFQEAVFLKNIAYGYNKLGNPAKSLSTIESSIRLMQEAGTKNDNTVLLDAKLTWASSLYDSGLREKALEINQDVYKITSDENFPSKVLAKKAQSDLAVHVRGVDMPKAIAYQTDIFKKNLDSNDLASPQGIINGINLTQNLIALKRTDDALYYGNTVLKALIDFRKKISDNDQLLSAWMTQSEAILNTLIALNLSQNRFDAFFLIEYFKSRSLSEKFQLSNLEGQINGAEYKNFKNIKFQLTQINQKIAVNQSLRIDSPELNKAHAELGKALSDYSLNHNFNDSIPTSKAPPPWYLALNELDPDALKISYKFLNRRLWVFVFNGKELYSRNIGDAEEIKKAINSYREYARHKALTSDGENHGKDEKTEKYLRYLSDKLVAPIQDRLGDAGKLLVSPDAEIGGIAYDDLYLNNKKIYQSFSVRMLPSFAIYKNLNELKSQYARDDRYDFLGFGGVSYESTVKFDRYVSFQRERPRPLSQMDLAVITDWVKDKPALLPIAMLNYSQTFKNIPYSLETIKNIAGKFPRGSIYTDERASEASVYGLMKSGSLEKYRIIHFAAHGYVNPYNPLLSAIVLSQTNRAPSTDGFLTASKISGLTLHSDLVVLQSCDTAYGKYQSGDGVIGLTYSFFEAGSVGVISALWPIGVKKSGVFFEHFYDELKSSSASEALRRTKVWAASHDYNAEDISAYVYYGL
jgi:CHAT domain-containing protein